MNRRTGSIAGTAVLLAVGLLGLQRCGAQPDDDDAPGIVAPPPAARRATAAGDEPAAAAPTAASATAPPPGPPVVAAEPGAARNAAIALDNGPPALNVYRCAAWARLQAENLADGRAARFRALAADFDAAIARIRDNPPAVVDESAGADAASGIVPEPEAVMQAEREMAAKVGPRRDSWLENAWARCDTEVAWLDEVRGALRADAD